MVDESVTAMERQSAGGSAKSEGCAHIWLTDDHFYYDMCTCCCGCCVNQVAPDQVHTIIKRGIGGVGMHMADGSTLLIAGVTSHGATKLANWKQTNATYGNPENSGSEEYVPKSDFPNNEAPPPYGSA